MWLLCAFARMWKARVSVEHTIILINGTFTVCDGIEFWMGKKFHCNRWNLNVLEFQWRFVNVSERSRWRSRDGVRPGMLRIEWLRSAKVRGRHKCRLTSAIPFRPTAPCSCRPPWPSQSFRTRFWLPPQFLWERNSSLTSSLCSMPQNRADLHSKNPSSSVKTSVLPSSQSFRFSRVTAWLSWCPLKISLIQNEVHQYFSPPTAPTKLRIHPQYPLIGAFYIESNSRALEEP